MVDKPLVQQMRKIQFTLEEGARAGLGERCGGIIWISERLLYTNK